MNTTFFNDLDKIDNRNPETNVLASLVSFFNFAIEGKIIDFSTDIQHKKTFCNIFADALNLYLVKDFSRQEIVKNFNEKKVEITTQILEYLNKNYF